MFGIIPKPLWSKTNPSDENNRVTLATRNLLLESDTRKILIDTGMGRKWDQKASAIYRINQSEFSIENSLAAEGIKPDEITDVILTHLHFDHTGGSTKIENDKIIPTFPNAVYYVRKSNYDWAVNPSERDRGSYLKENFEPLMSEGVLNFSDTEEEFDDEISFFVANGHTFGQQLVKISDGNETIFYCCDLIPFASHIRLPYIMGYDLQPLVTLEEKKKILELALTYNWKLFFAHDPVTAFATVKSSEKGIEIDEKFESF